MKSTTAVRKSIRPTFRPRLEALESRLTPTAYTVSNLADSGDGSLRAAITSVNGDSTPDEIDFSVAGVIQLASALPAITNTVKIDGSTAPNFAGVPLVEIDNHGFAGLTIVASNSSLASLSIVNANGPGVTLQGDVSSVVGSYLGLALDGSVAANTGVGLLVDLTHQTLNGAATVGGTTAADRNVISGNGAGGIQLGVSGQKLLQAVNILGNFIGTDPTGQAAAANQGNGITVFSDGLNNIGGTAAGAANTIAFNTHAGVLMDGSAGPVNSFDQQNAIISNSIFSNGSQGIVLQNNGNENMPAPQVSYAVESPGSAPGSVLVQVGGVLNAGTLIPAGDSSGLAFTIQVFATLSGVPAGQGQLFVGSVQGTTDPYGFVKFTLRNASVPAGAGTTFTATATRSSANFSSLGATSAFSNAVGVGTVNQAYVASVYQQLLNRIPDSDSTVWVDALNNGATPGSVVLGIEGSKEYLINQIFALYNRYLGRNPDADGEQFWLSSLQAGATFEAVAAQLLGSSEYFVLVGGTNPGFIGGLYGQVLGRPAGTSEIEGWQTVLDNGASRLFVAANFLVSQEYRNNLLQAQAPFPLQHTPYYMTFLLRPADSGGLTAWLNALNAGVTDQQVLAGIFGSAEGYQLWS
jgi:hypothetical protein